MAMRQLAPVLHYLRQVHTDARQRGHTDAGLLEQFVRQGDEAAFATLLQRHGPMVYGVCRRVLRDRHEAEDAFQATFLLLVRKARSLRQPELLGNWLHGVAYRTALKAKSLALRRGSDDRRVNALTASPSDDLIWRDLRPVLDDAINGLPAKYRVPFVLCHLQGLTNAQAARQMGCPEGTVATRLSRARQRLRTRLAKHGLGVAAGTLALGVGANAASATLPALLLVSTVRIAATFRHGATGAVPAKVAALTEGVFKAMFMAKLRFVLASVFLLAATVGGTGLWSYGVLAAEPVPPIAAQAVPPPAASVVRTVPALTVAEKDDAPAVARTTDNFVVHAPTRRIAQLVGDAAERARKNEAVRWLGKELPDWPEPCPLTVKISGSGAGGATVFTFDAGKVIGRNMHLEGTLEQVLSSGLPHEVTHTIFADHFRAAVPRWADEGAALMAEDEEEQQRHAALLLTFLDKSDRLIPLTKLLSLKSFPPDVMALYCEGYSLTRFLVGRHDRKTFLAFVASGMKDDNWDKSAKKYYGFATVQELQDAWLAQVRTDAKAHPLPENTRAEKRPAITSGPPVTGRASIVTEGEIILRTPACYVEAKTRYVKGGAYQADIPVTIYELTVTEQVERLDLKDVEATNLDGKPMDKNDLAKRLQTEAAVLIATDGKKVDPYYLAIVKEGTIILTSHAKESPRAAPPAPRAPERLSPTAPTIPR